jgi:hypothetical protein
MKVICYAVTVYCNGKVDLDAEDEKEFSRFEDAMNYVLEYNHNSSDLNDAGFFRVAVVDQ